MPTTEEYTRAYLDVEAAVDVDEEENVEMDAEKELGTHLPLITPGKDVDNLWR